MARHVGPLRRWVSGRLPRWARDLADTDDLVQDTLLRTFQKIDGFEARGVGALQAYLRQAVLNRVRDELRQKARSPVMVDGDGLRLEAAGSPLEDAMGREALERYQAALSRLTPEEREAIIAPGGDGIQLRRARRDARQTNGGRGAQSGPAGAAAVGRRK